MLYLLQF
nr:hypothetical fusion protein [Transmissible gastroenteritis virus]